MVEAPFLSSAALFAIRQTDPSLEFFTSRSKERARDSLGPFIGKTAH